MEAASAALGRSLGTKVGFVRLVPSKGIRDFPSSLPQHELIIAHSLLLLSEFHPRAMHFPPGDDGDDILAPADADMETLLRTDHDTSRSTSVGQSTFTNWTEPALRSDRMCWSLIGAAHTLAHELGLFGSFADAPPINLERTRHLQRILYIYLSQTSGRLGLSSLFPTFAGEDDFASLKQVLFDRES